MEGFIYYLLALLASFNHIHEVRSIIEVLGTQNLFGLKP